MKLVRTPHRPFLLPLLFAGIAAIAPVQGATFNLAGDWLADSSGNGLSNNSLVVLVASLDPTDGFAAPDSSSFVPGDDDIILSSFGTFDWGGALNAGSFTDNPAIDLGSISKGGETLDAGDPLALFWFPTLTTADLGSGPGTGTSFGMFHSATPVSGGDSWFVPVSNSATIDLTIAASDPGNVNTPSGGDVAILNPAKDNVTTFDLTANMVTMDPGAIPEPSTGILLLLGSGILFLRRQR
ncbi:MAG: PEP-CTERM sorting domain-containing protein [Verrucomicrobiota bacterium]